MSHKHHEEKEILQPEEAQAEEQAVPEPAADPVSELENKYSQLNDSYLRLMAEFDNFKKRTLREKAELIKSGGESVLLSFLPFVDDFERALAAAETGQDTAAIKEGLDLVYAKLLATLTQNGVKPINTEAQAFDTEYHEAITTIPAPAEDLKGKIIDCVQNGYTLNDKVVRYAKVVVGE